jgi:hypothetical protein
MRFEGKLNDAAVYTTNGSPFTYGQCTNLAYLIWLRFGCDMPSARAAWCRMLENDCPLSDFAELVRLGTPTEKC